MSTSLISVVICAYADHRWNELADAVRSIQEQETPAAEIVVSVDHNVSLAERARQGFPDVTVVENEGVRGLSGARNSGIAAAAGNIVAFLDDDAAAAPDWLTHLSRGFHDQQVIGVGGSIEPVWLAGRPAWFPDEFDWVVGCTYRGMPRTPAPVRNLIGANMAFRKEIFSVVGGFRSGIGRVGTVPVGCEETELCIRVRQRFPDAIFLYDPRARIYHRVPAERSTWSYFVRRCYAEGRSKTMVAQNVGLSDGLASERTYTMRTLPSGVARGVAETVRRAAPSGTARAAAIVGGLGVTTSGFAVSQLLTAWNNGPRRRARTVDEPDATLGSLDLALGSAIRDESAPISLIER